MPFNCLLLWIVIVLQSSMDHYDEDVRCNQFFIGFQNNQDLFEHVTSQRFMVCTHSPVEYILYVVLLV